ncbi:DUF4252 domain-containing protein [Aquimarina muelleri]|uniref:DUF4252 domain-containing protein n=1 Tax=Aquimarina muelleri TaxID=279356 RepID=A0A918N3Z5_9FLAO|nr:DUF4252 domain-containing protein [Aquimarina muelleri]MCX2763705.1 DUF4252 domain-containing protein [Aquimarina muelleri]GGX30464.1 hypothetical protein GCM10007384_34500 [Aquimarina muelleri]
MKNVYRVLGILSIILLMSCNREPSLQKYFVDHQGDNDFIAVDVPSSLLSTETIQLDKEEKEALESVKKINFLALPLKQSNQDKFEKESTTIKNILDSDTYETLVRFGSNGIKGVLKYEGEEDDIDEIIIFATDQKKGLALIRVLGDNMRPEKMAMLMKSVEKGKINLDAFKSIADSIDFD